MIIFDLDGVLANCDHRRHLIDRQGDHPDYYRKPCESCKDGSHHKIDPQIHKITGERWQPDWPAYYEACDDDEGISPCCEIFQNVSRNINAVMWTGRCESTREKTFIWLENHNIDWLRDSDLKMRPIGNTDPIEVLKEKWLDEQSKDLYCCTINRMLPVDHGIKMAFDAHPESIAMWKRRGIFVFDCRQGEL